MGMHADESYGTALVRRLQREYNNMIIDSFGTPDTPAFRAKLEKKNIELKIAEAQSARQEDLPFSEIDRLIAETEEEWNVQTPEERLVFKNAEIQAQVERDTARALGSLQPKKKFTTPRQKVRPPRQTGEVRQTGSYQDYQPPEPVGPVREPSPDPIDLEDSHAVDAPLDYRDTVRGSKPLPYREPAEVIADRVNIMNTSNPKTGTVRGSFMSTTNRDDVGGRPGEPPDEGARRFDPPGVRTPRATRVRPVHGGRCGNAGAPQQWRQTMGAG